MAVEDLEAQVVAEMCVSCNIQRFSWEHAEVLLAAYRFPQVVAEMCVSCY
jgi:hypothetical protein